MAAQASQAEQWKARQQATRAAGCGVKSHILRRKQSAEQEILSPMGKTSKSSVARARRLARDDVN